MWGAVGSLSNTLLQIYLRICQWKNSAEINRVTAMSFVSPFLEHGVLALKTSSLPLDIAHNDIFNYKVNF